MPATKAMRTIAAVLVGLFLSIEHSVLAQNVDEAAALIHQVIQLYTRVAIRRRYH
jgi:hypothetical protein